MPTERLTLSIPEVAIALGISRNLAYELARQDKLPVKVLKVGEKRMVVSRVALERILNDVHSYHPEDVRNDS